MKPSDENRPSCCGPECGCGGPSRRDFLKLVGAGAAAALGMPVMAGPFTTADFEKLVPADKKLSPEWVRSLAARGVREVYRGAELEKIGMPVGGLCAGQVYLGGDGRLWHWDVFNQHIGTGAAHYANPMPTASPLEQGFALRITAGGKSEVRRLDRSGFPETTFCGEYPIGYVDYQAAGVPVRVSLEAFSPFVPLDVENSSLPATVLEFALKNTGSEPVQVELLGWLENAVCLYAGTPLPAVRRNRVVQKPGLAMLVCSAEPLPAPAAPLRPPVVLADFEGGTYGDWTAEGEALGTKPAGGPMGNDQRLSGFQGKGLVNTYPGSDHPRGKLTSPEFTLDRHFISFLIGGGNHPHETCINLLVGGKVVRTSTGKNTDAMAWDNWNVAELAGRKARIEIIDNHSGGWGHVDVDQIELGDAPRSGIEKLDERPDYGTMTLALFDAAAADLAAAQVLPGDLAEAVFARFSPHVEPPREASGEKLTGALGRKLSLEPGQEGKVAFAVTWHFPNLSLGPARQGRHYAQRFASAAAVAEYLAAHFTRLAADTRLWHDTWYDSTLPYWFLDRTFLNTSILATSTSHWFADGRFYGWEGVGCCEGTCTHVWHYAQAVGRLFPPLERDLRERTDFGLAFDPQTGVIRFRGEAAGLAIDGQAGCILRSYREHQMSADDAFLRRNWEHIKRAMDCLIHEDGDNDGVLSGAQHNTLDANWYGPVAWLTGLYLAALRAAEEMARDVGDREYAERVHAIFTAGRRNLVARLFDGEYFINRPDPAHPDAINSGTGCEIDQVFGQSWAFQVGLGRVLPEEQTRAALRSLWKYNFSPDVGPYRQANAPGRWYAMAGEAGLLMCSFPRADWNYDKAKGKGPDWAAGYFNECMTGFEYQAAGHMLWEGMLQEGMAVARAIHDRYHPARRNPFNEVECGDHYARAMASYGVYLAACGYEYHGPKAHLGFAPRLAPDDFRAAFTTAEGWGTFQQKREARGQKATLTLRWGKLRLRTLALALAPSVQAARVVAASSGQPIPAKSAVQDGRLIITLDADLMLEAGQTLEVRVG